MSIGTLRSFAAAAVIALGSTAAHAVPMLSFSTVGDTGTIEYDGNIGTNDVDGLTAETTFTLIGISADGTEWMFEVTVRNTTDDTIWEEARVSRIGFDVDPSIVDAEATGSWEAVLNQSFPNQFGSIDLCVQATSQGDCSGGPGGPGIGETSSFDLTLFFASAIDSVVLDNFGVRYQSLTSEQLGFNGASGTGSGTPTTRVAEPATIALLGFGLLGLGLVRRRTARVEAN
jgi:hypothetical protein